MMIAEPIPEILNWRGWSSMRRVLDPDGRTGRTYNAVVLLPKFSVS
jgi:hypothetical protein